MKTRLLGLAVQILVLAIILSVVLLILGMGVLVLIRACTLGTFSRGNPAPRGGGGSDGGVDSRERGSHNGLSPDDLEKLPCYDYAAKDCKEKYSSECALCLEAFRDSDRCRLLPLCKHSFHAECVDSWLLKSSLCPLCRTICQQQLVGKGA